MTLPELQSCLDSLGVKLSLRLVIDAPAGVLTSEVVNSLKAHKPHLMAMLARLDFGTGPDRPTAPEPFWPGGPADDYDRQERAGIMEFDGGLSRDEAERRAGLR